MFMSALTLAAQEVISIEDIDCSWMGVMHMPIGPFGIRDQVGLKTVWTITDYWARQTGDSQSQANADFVKQYVDKGLLGAKTRQGVYSYPCTAFGKDGFLTGEIREDGE